MKKVLLILCFLLQPSLGWTQVNPTQVAGDFNAAYQRILDRMRTCLENNCTLLLSNRAQAIANCANNINETVAGGCNITLDADWFALSADYTNIANSVSTGDCLACQQSTQIKSDWDWCQGQDFKGQCNGLELWNPGYVSHSRCGRDDFAWVNMIVRNDSDNYSINYFIGCSNSIAHLWWEAEGQWGNDKWGGKPVYRRGTSGTASDWNATEANYEELMTVMRNCNCNQNATACARYQTLCLANCPGLGR